MKLKNVNIKDFKRFTSLTVQGIPETARLIILGWTERMRKVLLLRRTLHMVQMVLAKTHSMGHRLSRQSRFASTET